MLMVAGKRIRVGSPSEVGEAHMIAMVGFASDAEANRLRNAYLAPLSLAQ